MRDPTRALTLQLLEFISDRPRSYSEVIDAWRTTCPRLSIWEDACIAGLVDAQSGPGHIVVLTEKGQIMLESQRCAAVR
ncbi:MAG: hypothetical protein ABI854_08930, partial [Betaproteobacteria bacterium]